MTKRVLITGAAAGLGWSLAQQHHNLGWHVILVDRDQEKLAQCSEQLRTNVVDRSAISRSDRGAINDNPTLVSQAALNDRHETYCVDLTDTVAVAASLSPIFDQPLDLLINNAGITHRSQASVTDPEVFARVMAVNWSAPVWLTQQCLPALEQAAGGIVCISSMAAKMPVPGRAAYCASKAAMSQHFETWRPELLRREIDLLMVYPSFLNTSIEQNALGRDGTPTSRPRSVVGAILSADEMASVIVKSQQRAKQRLLTSQPSSRLGAWLWFHTPWLYQRITWRKFAMEIE